MGYSIEFAHDRGSPFYAEFAIVDRNTGELVDGIGVDHRFLVHDECRHHDYGRCCEVENGIVLASNSDGGITAPARGVVAVWIAISAFNGRQRHGLPLRFSLQAVPTAQPQFASLLASGTISFGERMSSPRITLGVYPLYPGSAAILTADPTTSQYLRGLAAYVTNGPQTLDAAVSADPNDPGRIVLEHSTTVPAGGAYEGLVASTFTYTVPQLAAIRALALQQTA